MQIKFGKMKTKKELLERVLLMMNYDSSKTLNENISEIKVISEQPNSNDPAIRARINNDLKGVPNERVEPIPTFRDTPMTMLNWLNNQASSKSGSKKYSNQDFQNVLDLFLNILSNMTLKQLLEFQLQYKRSISPGFIGFQNAKNTLFGDVLVDNEIYLRRLNGEKGYPGDDYNRSMGNKINIKGPQYNLLNSEIQLKITPFIGKGALQILSEKRKKEQDAQNKKNLESSQREAQKTKEKFLNQGCPFGDKKDGDDFRKWYNENHPEIAKTYSLSKSGEFCNTNIKNASKHVLNGKSMVENYYAFKNYMTLVGGQIEKKQSSKVSGCFFKDKTQGDEFRKWFNRNYPGLAKKEKYDLSLNGEYCNKNISNALNHKILDGPFKGKQIKDVYKEKVKWDFDMSEVDRTTPLSYDELFQEIEDNMPEELKNYFDNNTRPSVLDTPGLLAWRNKVSSNNDEKEKWEKWKQSIKFIDYPKILDYHQGYPVYSSNMITITAQDIDDPSKTKKYSIPILGLQIDDAIEKFYYDTTTSIYTQKVLDEDIIYEIFTKEAIDEALMDCEEEKVLAFLQGIIDGKVKNKQGQTVGKYYNDKTGKPRLAKWDDATPPCDDEWWSKNGLALTLFVMIGTAIVTGGLSLGPTASFLINLGVDTAINLYSLKKSYEADDYAAMKMDIAYIFLPFLMASTPVKNLLKQLKFGDDVINSVERKLKSIPQNATKQQVDDILLKMTSEEKRLIQNLSKEEYSDVIKQASDDILKKMKQTTAKSTIPIGRKISEPLINILVYGAPAVAYTVNKISEMFTKKAGKSLTQKEKALWGKALSFLTEQSQTDLNSWMEKATKEQLLEIQNSKEMKDALLRTQNPENLSREEINKEAQEILDVIKLIEEKTELDLKTKDSENEDLDFDEYDVEEWDKILGGSEQ